MRQAGHERVFPGSLTSIQVQGPAPISAFSGCGRGDLRLQLLLKLIQRPDSGTVRTGRSTGVPPEVVENSPAQVTILFEGRRSASLPLSREAAIALAAAWHRHRRTPAAVESDTRKGRITVGGTAGSWATGKLLERTPSEARPAGMDTSTMSSTVDKQHSGREGSAPALVSAASALLFIRRSRATASSYSHRHGVRSRHEDQTGPSV